MFFLPQHKKFKNSYLSKPDPRIHIGKKVQSGSPRFFLVILLPPFSSSSSSLFFPVIPCYSLLSYSLLFPVIRCYPLLLSYNFFATFCLLLHIFPNSSLYFQNSFVSAILSRFPQLFSVLHNSSPVTTILPFFPKFFSFPQFPLFSLPLFPFSSLSPCLSSLPISQKQIFYPCFFN